MNNGIILRFTRNSDREVLSGHVIFQLVLIMKEFGRHSFAPLGRPSTLLVEKGLYTVLCEVKAILNSRPITKAPTDPNDH